MNTGTTPNGVDYSWNNTSSKGARFELYPERDRHTDDHVAVAKKWLYREHEVLSLQIRWKLNNDKSELPLKIHDKSIISSQQQEIGKLESYIQELEDKLKNPPEMVEKNKYIRQLEEMLKIKSAPALTSKEKIAMKSQEDYVRMSRRIKTLENELDAFRKSNSDSVMIIFQLREKLKKYE